MAYGVSASVSLILGIVDTDLYTAADISAAIAMGDSYVDELMARYGTTDTASTAAKTQASNLISAQILLRGKRNFMLKGLQSNSGDNNFSGKTADFSSIIPPEADRLLRRPKKFTAITREIRNIS